MWDDATNNLGLHPGLMATHDNETYAYFKGTAVKCVLCPRQGGGEDSIFQVRRQRPARCAAGGGARCSGRMRACALGTQRGAFCMQALRARGPSLVVNGE